jgi:hypothetical protein
MTFAWSNILAAVAVVCLPVVGGVWIAPKLCITTKRCFFALNLWGVPFVLGQFSQEDEWGSLWFQYHFLDLCYTPWGTALLMCLIPASAERIGKKVPKKLFAIGLILTLGFGYLTEVWDTAWSLYDGASLRQAVDVGDYATLTLGAIAAVAFHLCVVFHLRLRQGVLKEVMS